MLRMEAAHYTRPHGITFLDAVIFIATAVRTLNIIEQTSIAWLVYTNFGDWKPSTLKTESGRSTETFITIFTSDKASIDKITVNKSARACPPRLEIFDISTYVVSNP
jgi:hypothetical protein